MRTRSPLLLTALAGLALTSLTACGSSSKSSGGSTPSSSASAGASAAAGSSGGSGGSGGKVAIVAFSTPKVVFDEMTPLFQKTDAGAGVSFTSSYGASGDQSRAVANGQGADFVMLSIEPDITRLVKAGLVDASWNQGPDKGVLAQSQVGFVVRKGNPKGIATWDDLLKPGVKVLTPNPFSSGAAKWNILAAYLAYSDGGKDKATGIAKLTTLLTKQVPVEDKSGADALNTFISGTGDVLLDYDYEVTTANKKGESLDLVRPAQSMRIDLDYALTTKASAAAKAFAAYAASDAGQAVFAEWGYKPVDAAVLAQHTADFPTPATLYSIDDLGGWAKANTDFFDPDNGIVTKIQGSSG